MIIFQSYNRGGSRDRVINHQGRSLSIDRVILPQGGGGGGSIRAQGTLHKPVKFCLRVVRCVCVCFVVVVVVKGGGEGLKTALAQNE